MLARRRVLVVVRLADAAHAGAVRDLFGQVFQHPLSDALWQWKYAHGRGSASGLWQGDALIAHYGGTRRALCLGAATMAGVQMGDVMVQASARGLLSRHGAFATVARHYIEQRVAGPDAGAPEGERFDIGFGFPSARHARLGGLLGMYRALGEVRELRWAAQPRSARQALTWQRRPLDLARLDARDTALLERLWCDMRQALGAWVLPQRDAAWCRHRYAQHPQQRYLAAALRHRITRRVVGVVILKPGADAW